VLVPPRSPEALADAITMLVEDPASRRRMGMAAKQSVLARFGHQRLVDDVERLYASTLAEKRGFVAG
jgi:glycosyltransferase involved in cell wall biosynthesis